MDFQPMDTFHQVQSLLCEIEDAMRRDGENNWIRGIRWAIERMEAAEMGLPEVSQAEALRGVKSIYGSMFGPGKFDDYIFGLDPELQTEGAKRFEALKAELSEILALLP